MDATLDRSTRLRRVAVALAGGCIAITPAWWWRESAMAALGSQPATVDDVIGPAALVALTVVLGWLGLGLALAALAAGPGLVAAAAARGSSVLTPRLVRRAAVAAVGLSLAGAASPASAHATAESAAALSAAAAASLPERAGALTTTRSAGTDLPPLDRPETSPVVIVQPGDCLWSIAAHHLEPGATDAVIAAEWPRWYEANRSLIGADPNLLHPGQQLVGPP